MTKKSQIEFTPVPGYILVDPLEETSVSGISVVAEDFPQLAKVLKVGGGYFDKSKEMMVDAPCKVGQVIVHSSFGFEKFRHEGHEYRVVPFEKVLLIHT